jgi:hypothetical protein
VRAKVELSGALMKRCVLHQKEFDDLVVAVEAARVHLRTPKEMIRELRETVAAQKKEIYRLENAIATLDTTIRRMDFTSKVKELQHDR